jgi:UDP-N-acetylglucosamine:LPS N-acetylglucosamine transferase
VDAGAAQLILQSDCRAETLLAAIIPLLDDCSQRAAMGGRAKKLAMPHAAEHLADALVALVKK